MDKKLRTCAVCMKKYKFCNNCREDKDKPLWYFTFCSEKCKDIYDITSKFEGNRIDKYTAKKQLECFGLTNIMANRKEYQDIINKILEEPNEKVVEDVIENTLDDDVSPIKKTRNKKIKEVK